MDTGAVMAALPKVGEEIDINALSALPAVGEEIDLSRFTPVAPPEESTPQATANAPWYSLQGINERLAPTDPLNPNLNKTDALLAPEMNASKQMLRTLFGLAGEARTGGPIGAVTQPIKGVIDSIAGVPSSEREMIRGELDKRGLGTDMSQSAADRYRKAGNTVLQEPLTPAMDYGLAKGVAKGAPKLAQTLAEQGYKRWVEPPAQSLENNIAARVNQGVSKGIRQSVFGRGNYSKLTRAEALEVEAFTKIIENKQNLKLTQPDGTVAEGVLPKGPTALRQSLEALHQTKASTWAQVDAMLKEAGGKGLEISTDHVSGMMLKAANNPALDISPAARKYLFETAKRLKGKKYSLETTNEMITNINAENQAYHKSNNPADTQPAAIKEVLAQYLRNELDKAVTSQTGPGFQAAKDTYGALLSVEKNLAHRVVVSGRAAPVSLFDHFSNLGAGLETAKALMTADPVAAVRGLTIEGVKAYTKRKNNPNHIMESMFEDTAKLMDKRPKKPSGGPAQPLNLPDVFALEAAEKARLAAEAKARIPPKQPGPASSPRQGVWPPNAAVELGAESPTTIRDNARAAAINSGAEFTPAKSGLEQFVRRKGDFDARLRPASENVAAAAEEGMGASTPPLAEFVKQKARELAAIPEGKQISLEGVGPKGKKFSYTEDARTAFTEATDTIAALDSVSSSLGEGTGSLPGNLKKFDVPPAVRTNVIAKAKKYEAEGFTKEEAAASAVNDTMQEWQSTHKSILSQLGIKP